VDDTKDLNLRALHAVHQTVVFHDELSSRMPQLRDDSAALPTFSPTGTGGRSSGNPSLVVEAFHGLDVEIDPPSGTRSLRERQPYPRPVLRQPLGRLKASPLTAAEWRGDGLRSVAQIDETARDLSDRMTIYAEQLPQIARWQSEILLMESQRKYIAKPLASVDGVDRSLNSIRFRASARRSFRRSTSSGLRLSRH
jgi:hypothetical protein